MPRKKKETQQMDPSTNGTAVLEPPTETNPETTSPGDTVVTDSPPPEVNGTTEKRHLVFKVGPIPTDRTNAVSVAVWANEVEADGRTFTVYNLTVEARWRDASGEWKSGKQFRGSQVYALVYCLQRASDWICAQRDPQQAPF